MSACKVVEALDRQQQLGYVRVAAATLERELLIMLMVQGNDIGEDRVMTFSDVRDEVCRLVMRSGHLQA